MLSMIFLTTPETCLMLLTIGNKVTPSTKQMDMALRTLPSILITHKTLLDLVNKFMHRRSTTFLTTPATYQTLKITDSKVTQSTKQTDMVPKTSASMSTTPKTLLVLANKFMLKQRLFHKMQVTCQTLRTIDNKATPSPKPMVMDHRISPSMWTTQ